jgi:type VI secretion system secreted protein VgrG
VANVKIAIDFTLRQEDGKMTGKVTTLRGDSGGPTRFGIALHSHPELVEQGFFDEARVNCTDALKIAEAVYRAGYAEPMHIDKIDDQAVATAVFSFGINCGITRPVRTLQQAVNRIGFPVEPDGRMGTITERLVNRINPDLLLATFCSLARRYYSNLAAAVPADAPNLHGWLNRVAAWQSNAAMLRQQAKG